MSRSIMWFRRDLRLIDNPALLAAIEAGDEIVPVFILDPQLIKITGEKGLAYLAQSLRSLDESLGNKLLVCEGDPVDVLTELKKKYETTSVHISAEYDAYAVARDARVSLGYLSEVERGQKEASSELLNAICTALGLTLSSVISDVSRDISSREAIKLTVVDAA